MLLTNPLDEALPRSHLAVSSSIDVYHNYAYLLSSSYIRTHVNNHSRCICYVFSLVRDGYTAFIVLCLLEISCIPLAFILERTLTNLYSYRVLFVCGMLHTELRWYRLRIKPLLYKCLTLLVERNLRYGIEPYKCPLQRKKRSD